MIDESPARQRPAALDHLAIGLTAAAALLLLGGIIFAFAGAAASTAVANARFRLLGQAANPFIVALALGGAALVVFERTTARVHQAFAGAALGTATAVALSSALLTLNGVVLDLTTKAPALARISYTTSRLSTLVLCGLCLWLAATAPPARRDIE